MNVVRRHAAIFVLTLCTASLVAFFVPDDVDPKDVFFYFMIAFAAYLAISLLWPARARGSRGRR